MTGAVSFDPSRRQCPLQKERIFPINYRILSFLEPLALTGAEQVCSAWKEVTDCTMPECTSLWELQYRRLYKIPGSVNAVGLAQHLPPGSSYREGVLSKFLIDQRFYARYLGTVPPAPPIPRELHPFRISEKPDPCDQTQTIGEAYVWVYVPPYVEMSILRLNEDKQGNGGGGERCIIRPPLRLRRQGSAEPCFENQFLVKAPLTLKNLAVMFEHPKQGNPSTYRFRSDEFLQEHGDTPIPSGWICLRKDVVCRERSFSAQQGFAKERGVKISTLAERVLYNFLRHVGCGTANVYPDGQAPRTFARTQTFTNDSNGNPWPLGCGIGGPSGLYVASSYNFDDDLVGVAVALPAEV